MSFIVILLSTFRPSILDEISHLDLAVHIFMYTVGYCACQNCWNLIVDYEVLVFNRTLLQ